jgi:flagellar biosynthesis/type III secretory pathway chaperone
MRGDSMIDRQAEKIIEILQKEQRYYKDLLELSNKKKSVIIGGQIPELEKIIKIEQNIIFDLGQLEKHREEELQKLCGLMQLDSGSTMTELSSLLPEQLAKLLKGLQQEMGSTIKELQSVNDINGQLIQQSLEYIEYTVNMITSTGPANSLYDDLQASGKQLNHKKRLFDTKV